MKRKTKTSAGTAAAKEAAPGSPGKPRRPTSATGSDLRGVSRRVIDAVTGVTDIVKDMHRNIARVSPIVGAAPAGRAGIS